MDRPLASTDVLLLDCQSTGASPERGHLLEVAWCRARAGDLRTGTDPGVETHLVALPGGKRLPRRIAKLTGIADEELAAAVPAAEAWERLIAPIDALRTEFAAATAVAHFARFETAFLNDLHARHGGDPSLPVDWICTHEIACRLLPGLPRRGLKAVAGYLGHGMPEGKRAAAHVRATAFVWGRLVERLEEEEGVTTLHGLREWMTEKPAVRTAGREFAIAREKRLELPDAPGVYRMLGRGGRVLYVGKATSLRHRVNSYFQKRRHTGARTLELLTQVFDLDTTRTASALEASLHECDEIKCLAPPYNVALRGRQGTPTYASADLSGVRERPDAEYRHGPVPHGEHAPAWSALCSLLSGNPERASAHVYLAALGLREETALDLDCAGRGLSDFAARHACTPGEPLSRTRFMGIGARLWREYQAARAAEPEPAEEEAESEEPVERSREPWAPETPEQIVSLLEATVRHGAHLLRRGRWLRRLCESGLAWDTGSGGRRTLTLESGHVVRAEDLKGGGAAPTPPGWDHSRRERSRCFDVATYDRLRVLTTELRRLVAAERAIDVCLAPGRRLDTAGLARVLYWI